VKIFIALVLFGLSLVAKEYYAKVEPIDIYTVSSNVQGEVVDVKENLVGKKLSQTPYIIIDATIDIQELASVKEKIKALEEMVKADKQIIKNLHESLSRKEENYEKIKDLSVKSKTQKDAVYFDVIATKNQLLATKKELANFQMQIADLKTRQTKLEKSIHDKKVHNPSMALYELLVKKHQVVTIATPLAKVADISKGILTIYVDEATLKNIQNKKVYINDKVTPYKVSRVSFITDSVNISKYKVQIIINPPKIFSKLVKVELK
jgi:hypothetical protein